jgi:hypothetical protein
MVFFRVIDIYHSNGVGEGEKMYFEFWYSAVIQDKTAETDEGFV